MITQIQQDLEDNIYKELKEGNVGKEVIAKYYPRQSIEELVDILMKGYKMSWVSNVVKQLESRDEVPNFEAMCDAAFRDALLRLLKDQPCKTCGGSGKISGERCFHTWQPCPDCPEKE